MAPTVIRSTCPWPQKERKAYGRSDTHCCTKEKDKVKDPTCKLQAGCAGVVYDFHECRTLDRDYRIFRKADPSCDPSLHILDDHCVRTQQPLDWPALQRKKYWFMGFSVTRHYCDAMGKLMNKDYREFLDRREEKKQYAKGFSPANNVKWAWKLYMGLTPSIYDQRGGNKRDWCIDKYPRLSTEECIKKLTAGATQNDVLFVGSWPVNTTYYHAHVPKYDPWQHGDVANPQFADAAAHSDQRNTMAMLERAFPGAIFWHNYPHMIQEMHNGVQYFDLNHCNTYTNSVLRCASQGFPRVQYIDASEFQARHPEMYLDLIHQPGDLTDRTLKAALSLLQPEVKPFPRATKSP